MANKIHFLTWQEVVEQMLSYLPPSWRTNQAGKVMKRLIVAYALAVEQIYALLARLLRLSIVATSEGEWLRALVQGFNMETYGGTAATVVVRFRRYVATDKTVTIPLGAQVGAVRGQKFVTTIPAIIPPGQTEVEVPCRCIQTGEFGNIDAGEIISMVPQLPGVDEVTNPFRADGGHDAESDIEIKARLPKHIEALHRATIPATEYAVAIDRETFPEVQSFVTQRNYGTPGYFRGILCDWTGGDLYRPTNWVSAGNGVWWARTDLDIIYGMNAEGWMCKRFGIVDRTPDGEEVWLPCNFVAEVEQGNWRFCHDKKSRRIYARADGNDLNDLHITLYAGVVWRTLRYLESNWVANGVFVDIIVPFAKADTMTIEYYLQPGFSQVQVESDLRNRAIDYVSALLMGQMFELEQLYTILNRVAGASGVVVQHPDGNVLVKPNEVFRLSKPPIVVRKA